jgi:hypothetical protein
MRRPLVLAATAAFAIAAPSPLSGQAWDDVGVLRPPRAASIAALPAQDNRPTIPGSIFIGTFAWYPGALGGALLFGVYQEHFEPGVPIAVAVAGGMTTGLAIGAATRTSPGCPRAIRMRDALLGAEIGSLAAGAALGLFQNGRVSSGGAALVVLPLASATGGTLLARRCHER